MVLMIKKMTVSQTEHNSFIRNILFIGVQVVDRFCNFFLHETSRIENELSVSCSLVPSVVYQATFYIIE